MSAKNLYFMKIYEPALKNGAVLLVLKEYAEDGRCNGVYHEGSIKFDSLAEQFFSTRTFELSDYCIFVSGTAHIMHVQVDAGGTLIEFIAEITGLHDGDQ